MNLFEIPPDRPSVRKVRMAQIEAWNVSDWKIRTHNAGPSPFGEKWCAISIAECHKRFKDYGSSIEMSIGDFFANWCRLMDEAGLISYGKTEFSACEALVQRLEKEEKV